MKLEKITERYNPTKGTTWHITYSGCKSANNGFREYFKKTLTKKELEFVLNTKPTKRINLPDGTVYYHYNAE